MTTYRAAFIADTALTGPEHSDLSDTELIAEALDEAEEADLRITADEIEIGDWTAAS